MSTAPKSASFFESSISSNRDRAMVLLLVTTAICYSLVVIWYVATFPDVGVRCLLPDSADDRELEVVQFVNSPEDCLSMPVQAGSRIFSARRKPADNFLRFMGIMADLRNAPLPPGGKLNPGQSPAEEQDSRVPELVERPEMQDGKVMRSRRFVEVEFYGPSAPNLKIRTYLVVKPLRFKDFAVTISWFLCQLIILLAALAAWWQRPGDSVARLFCLMSGVSMPAFVGGFHWWILAANPILNIPFIVAACLLPAITLHFFSVFPQRTSWIPFNREFFLGSLYGPTSAMAILIVFLYWAAYSLAGVSTDTGTYSAFQKLVSTGISIFSSADGPFNATQVSGQLLFLLRLMVFSAIGLSTVYFSLSVTTLSFSLFRSQNVVEKKQASGILKAALVAALPIAYSLYLAFFNRVEFALGGAQWPMFMASTLFMAAYANGMLKHRLILSNDFIKRGRQYSFLSASLTIGFAVLLSVGGVVTFGYGLPSESTWPLRLTLFLVLVIGIALVLWARDRIQDTVDQRFFSEKYQLDRTLKKLNTASGYLTDPTSLARMTLGSCQDVLGTSTTLMFVREATGNFRLIGADSEQRIVNDLSPQMVDEATSAGLVVRRIPSPNRESLTGVQKLLHEIPAELICFLRTNDRIDGLIALGERDDGHPYTSEDVAFLQAMAQMTVLALHSSRANQDLARLDSELQAKVDRIAEQQRQLSLLRAELTSLQASHAENDSTDQSGLDRGEIRGNSAALSEILETIRKAAPSSATILIRGESGTGKELLARVVHRNSDRSNQPLITVNCAALAPSLLESELFGHVKGAFTGANSDKVGRFQAADSGTLFLDEIGDISLETQVKLLRVLQERCFEPVGTTESRRIDVRLIAATNRDLESMIATGEFREDLYYRLNVVSVTLPPLRSRLDDLIELVFFFLNRTARKTNKRISQIEPAALQAIEQHRWPGNVRELENVIERAVVLADGESITLKDLPPELKNTPTAQPPVANSTTDEVILKSRNSTPEKSALHNLDATANRKTLTLPNRESQRKVREEAEISRMVQALHDCEGNRSQAARSLNMPRSTFYSKLKKYGLDQP